MSTFTYSDPISDCRVDVVSSDRLGRPQGLRVTLDPVARVVLISDDLLIDLIRRANPGVDVVVTRGEEVK